MDLKLTTFPCVIKESLEIVCTKLRSGWLNKT